MRKSIMVNKIDTEKLTKLMYWKNVEAGSDSRPEGEAMVIVNTPKGLATICNEGVGWFKNDDGTYVVTGYMGYSDVVYRITEDELLSLVSSEQVDLAEFIRVFGARLESNFYLWYEQVKDTSQDISAFDFA
jgi:hypothetical protein